MIIVGSDNQSNKLIINTLVDRFIIHLLTIFEGGRSKNAIYNIQN